MSRRVSCATCVTRQRKCDGTQPICRHCARDGVECGGYPSSRNPTRGLADSRKPPPAPFISSANPSTFTSSSPPDWNYSLPSVSDISSSEPGTPSDHSNIDGFLSPPERHGATKSLMIGNPLPSVPPAPPIRHILTPPDPSLGIGLTNKIPRIFLPPKKDVRQSMTPGQASLFDALFSLARPEDDNDILGSSHFLERHPFGPVPPPGPSYNLGYERDQTVGCHDQTDPEDSCDAQAVAARLSYPLALDKKVKSNALPFVLQSYALWIRQFLFEPIRIIPVGREYILDEYAEGPEARWRMLITSNAVRAITRSTGYSLDDFETLQFHMYQGFPKAGSTFGADRGENMVKALLAMSTTYEFIAISLKVFPLSNVIKSMQAVGPIFRRACPDPDDRQINLPTLMSNINIPLEYYACLDIVLGAILNRPMYFRYDTTFPPGVHESIFNIENGPGLRWTNGIPDRLVITLAKMNNLFEDFGPTVDPEVVAKLEMEIKGFKSIVVASTDPDSEVGRLVVQESWRQAAYIYLYMGLCGCDSHDPRVMKAHDEFMGLLTRTKPGRIPDSFLILPLPLLGIATRHPDEQQLLKGRMLAVPECSRRGTTGNQFIRMLEFMWGLANDYGRPTTWSDLRLASSYVAGV